MVVYKASSVCLQKSVISSFGFSGAGFLACYHLGVAQCLLRHGHLPRRGSQEQIPMLTGVSAGAIVTTGIAAGVDMEEGMNAAMSVVRRARTEPLDAFHPGFSLVDEMEKVFLVALQAAIDDDNELLMRRMDHGRLLRIGLTDRRVFPPFRNPRAYCYVDRYRDIHDLAAAVVLSSYIPGLTGPLVWSSASVSKAWQRMTELIELGCVKKQVGNKIEIVTMNNSKKSDTIEKNNNTKKKSSSDSLFWDGGLVNAFPVVDCETVLVTPFAGVYDPNPSISPKSSNASTTMKISDRVRLHRSLQNARTLRCVLLSSDESILQNRFEQGYNDANDFLKQRSLQSVYAVSAAATC